MRTPHLRHELFESPLALLTRHGKEKLLAPVLESSLGCRIQHIDSFDTDQLGTFTRDIPRIGSQLDAARKKANLAAQISNCRFSVSSEGAFGPDPWAGLMPWNIELILLKDHATGLELTGIAQGSATNNQQSVSNIDELLNFAEASGFPNHHLVLRPVHTSSQLQCMKGISTKEELQGCFLTAQLQSSDGMVYVENDLRAHCNPTRQKTIIKATENLLLRLKSDCPSCGQPGFWVKELQHGLPCRYCLTPTQKIKAEQWQCPHCTYQELKNREGEEFADPLYCPQCNP